MKMLLFSAVLGAPAVIFAPPAAAQQMIPLGQIDTSSKLRLGSVLHEMQEGSQIIIQPDPQWMFCAGVTSDIRCMIDLSAAGFTRTPLDWSSGRLSVIDYGADPLGVVDSTAAFAAALASERPISAPCGVFRLASTLEVKKRAEFRGSGPCTLLKFDLPEGLPVLPAIDLKPSAGQSSLANFRVDHQAHVKGYRPNTVYGGNIIASSAILVQSDDTALSQITVDNAYDNGIAVVQFTSTDSSVNPGSPKRYSLKMIRTSYCGVGSTPRAGAGVDIGTGSFGTVDDLVDVGSYGAFILDLGAGGQGSFSNLIGISTKVDHRLGYSYTFYIGSGNSTFTNLYSQEAADGGLWLDGSADRTALSNIIIKAPKGIGAKIKAGNSIISGLIVNSAGYTKPTGTIDAIELDSTANTLRNVVINGLSVQDEFSTARYGINRVGSGPLTGAVVNAIFAGATTPTNNLPATFGVVDGRALAGGWITFTPTVSCASGAITSSSTSGAWRRIGRTVDVQMNLGLTAVGDCHGTIFASLPHSVSDRAILSGQETGQTGVGLIGTAFEATSVVQIKRYDGDSLALNSGMTLTFNGTYQAQ